MKTKTNAEYGKKNSETWIGFKMYYIEEILHGHNLLRRKISVGTLMVVVGCVERMKRAVVSVVDDRVTMYVWRQRG